MKISRVSTSVNIEDTNFISVNVIAGMQNQNEGGVARKTVLLREFSWTEELRNFFNMPGGIKLER